MLQKSRKLGEVNFAETHLATVASLNEKVAKRLLLTEDFDLATQVVLKEPFRARGLDRGTLEEIASLAQLKKHPVKF